MPSTPEHASSEAAAAARDERKPTVALLAPAGGGAGAPAPAPAPTPVPAPEVYEVQGCSTDCDFPCLSACGQTWDECYVEREYAGTYDLRMAADNELITGVLRRHVRRKGEEQQRKRARKPRGFTS